MRSIVLFSTLLLLYAGCTPSPKITREDTPTSGFALLVSDDSFGNITQEEIDVFEALNQDANLYPIYTSEKEAINLLMQDSVRLAILARDLTQAEKEEIKSRNKTLLPRSQKIAIDGIAVIINKSNTDSLISLASLQKIMAGDITSWKELNSSSHLNKMIVVFDNPSSGTVRFIKDSICGGLPLSDHPKALNNNREVLDYVARTPEAMGIIGVNWISNPNDSTQLSFNEKIRVMSISRTHPATPESSYQPFPAWLFTNDYPLTRDVYAVLTDLRGTLPAGFAHFMGGDRGQRIILKSGLVPATRPIRTIQIKDHF